MGRTYSIHKELGGRTMVEWLIILGLVGILALLMYMDRDDY
jgi:Tfp pilus assembly protein PilE